MLENQKVYGAYVHAFPTNEGEVFYVGKGDERRSRSLKGRGIDHQDVIDKTGKENIRICFIPCESEKEAFALERSLIKIHRIIGQPLTNKTDGGEGPSGLRFKMSEEAKQKISASLKGRPGTPHTEETKKRLSDIRKTKVGWKHSEETKAKIKAAHTGKKKSPEHVEKMRQAPKGKKLSAEHIAKLRAGHKRYYEQS